MSANWFSKLKHLSQLTSCFVRRDKRNGKNTTLFSYKGLLSGSIPPFPENNQQEDAKQCRKRRRTSETPQRAGLRLRGLGFMGLGCGVE